MSWLGTVAHLAQAALIHSDPAPLALGLTGTGLPGFPVYGTG